MKKIVLLLILMFANYLSATNYYVSNSGNDNNDGLTENSAWLTIDRANREMSKLKPGDKIFFRKGDIFYGTLRISEISGSQGNEIVIDSYGFGQNPVITNAKIIDNWQRYSGNIYVANMAENTFQLFRNGESLPNARTPKSKELTIASVNSQTNFISEQLNGTNDLVGGTVVIKVRSWYLNDRGIVSFNSSTGDITIDKKPNYDMRPGNEFYVVNHLNLIDEQDEWSYDASNQRLYLYSTVYPENVLAAVSDNNGIEIDNSNHIVIKNIGVNYVNKAGIFCKSSNHITITNNTIKYAYASGILTEKGGELLINKNTIIKSIQHGIYNYSDNSRIENNRIEDIGIMKYMTYKKIGQSYGIKLKGQNNVVKGNKILNSGYIGIRFYHAKSTIENNFIKDFCMELSDGGGIYSYNTSFSDVGASGSIVKKNIIVGSNAPNKDHLVAGFYADDRAHDITFDGNSVTNVERGVFLHNTKRIKVTNNNIYNVSETGIGFSEDYQDGEMVENLIENNIVFMEQEDVFKYPLKIKSKWNNYKMGNFSNNKYYNPYSYKKIGVRNPNIYWLNSGNPKSLSIDEWQNLSGSDSGTEENNFYWDSFELIDKQSQNLISNGGFENGYSGWGSPNSDLSTVKKDDRTYLIIRPTASKGAALSNIFTVGKKKYLFEFDIKATGKTTIRLDIAKTGAPYTNLLIRPIWATNEWRHYAIPLTSEMNTDDIRLNFITSDSSIEVHLDSVSFTQVELDTAPKRSHFAYNNQTISAEISIPPGIWKDLNGSIYQGSINLKPFSSRILIISDQETAGIEANAGTDVSICQGESTILTASGGTGYLWSTGETTRSITVSPESTKTYTVTVSNAGETDKDDVVVNVNTVNADAGPDRTINEGETVTLVASGGDSYLWNTGETTESITVSPNSTITYRITVGKGSCEDTDDVKITVNPLTGGGNPVIANAGTDVSICQGESTILTASGGTGYLWSTGETTRSITVSPESTKTYTVTVSNAGETDKDDVVVNVDTVNADAGPDRTINEGETITLVASGGDSYLWSTGATAETITVSPKTNVTYTVTAIKGLCMDTDEVKITVNTSTNGGNPVTANAGLDVSICKGESTTLTASGGTDYLWSNGATTKSITVSPSSTTTYLVTVSYGDTSDIDEVIVTVNEVNAYVGADRTIKEGEVITLAATGGESYLWNTGEKTNSITVSPSITKVYSVIAYKGKCQDFDEVRVSVVPKVSSEVPPAQADAGEDMTICLGETIVLNGSGGETYQWSNGETSSRISVSPIRTTTYDLAATRGGVTNSDSVTITVENCESQIIGDEEEFAILEMEVYPNPTKGKLTIQINNLDEDANFIINDIKGSLIYSDYISGKKIQFEKQINLSRYSDGLYFVRLYSAEQYLVKKVMVQ